MVVLVDCSAVSGERGLVLGLPGWGAVAAAVEEAVAEVAEPGHADVAVMIVVAAGDTAVGTLAVAVVVDAEHAAEPAVDAEPAVESAVGEAAGETADSVEVDPVAAEGIVQAALAVAAGCSGTTEVAGLPIEFDVSAADSAADEHAETVVLDEKTEVSAVAVGCEEDNPAAAAAVADTAEEQAYVEEKYSVSVLQVSQQVF